MQQIKLDFHKVVFSKFQCALIDSRKLNNKCLKTEKGKNFHVLNSISVFKKRKTEVQWFDLFFYLLSWVSQSVVFVIQGLWKERIISSKQATGLYIHVLVWIYLRWWLTETKWSCLPLMWLCIHFTLSKLVLKNFNFHLH